MFYAPGKTSVIKVHNGSPQNIVSFASELIEFIKNDQKVRTYRLSFDQKYAQMKVGDVVKIKNHLSQKIICQAIITSKRSSLFKDLPATSAISHESYRTKEEQRKVFNGYYAFLKRPIQDDDQFIILDFKLI